MTDQEKIEIKNTIFAVSENKEAARKMLEKYPDFFTEKEKTCLKYLIGDLPKDYDGNLDFYGINKLPDNVKFENKGYVFLNSLTTLPDNIKFENEGYVNLYSLNTLPDNVKFENEGYVYIDERLYNHLPENFDKTKFKFY